MTTRELVERREFGNRRTLLQRLTMTTRELVAWSLLQTWGQWPPENRMVAIEFLLEHSDSMQFSKKAKR